jgi:hypothetical protein
MSKHSKAVRIFMAIACTLPFAFACDNDIAGPTRRGFTGPVEGTQVQMRLEPGSVVLQLGATVQLKAELTGYDGTPLGTLDREILWHSSDENVATVNDYGLVVAHAVGDVVITAESADDVAYANIKVIEIGTIDPPFRPGRGR